MKLPSAAEMRQLDATAIETYGIPSIVLMENAGRCSVEELARRFGDPAGRRIAIFAGPGNNGGDGLVIARHLHQRGALPQLFFLTDPDSLGGDAAINLAVVRRLPIPVHFLRSEEELQGHLPLLAFSWLAVDALFGTGLSRELTGLFAAAVRLMNALPCPRLAVDIPSGLHADTGLVLGEAVRAELTVTFACPKPGLVTEPGKEWAGQLVVADIGIPPEAAASVSTELLDQKQIVAWLPARPQSGHKGTFGHLLVLAGSRGKTGAAILACQGALRTGAGLVTLLAPGGLNDLYECALSEPMTVPLAGDRGRYGPNDYPVLLANLAGKKALALGPGISTEPDTAALVKKIYLEVELPMVVDADALTILASEPELIGRAAGPRILTPHPGEMARLSGLASREIQADRLPVAKSFAREHGVHLVLKGCDTVVASPGGHAAVNPTGNPGMAAGGMGDVLTGLIGGFLAQGADPWRAACLGVFLHGAAGDRLAARKPFGYTASELARQIPHVLKDLLYEKS